MCPNYQGLSKFFDPFGCPVIVWLLLCRTQANARFELLAALSKTEIEMAQPTTLKDKPRGVSLVSMACWL